MLALCCTKTKPICSRQKMQWFADIGHPLWNPVVTRHQPPIMSIWHPLSYPIPKDRPICIHSANMTPTLAQYPINTTTYTNNDTNLTDWYTLTNIQSLRSGSFGLWLGLLQIKARVKHKFDNSSQTLVALSKLELKPHEGIQFMGYFGGWRCHTVPMPKGEPMPKSLL